MCPGILLKSNDISVQHVSCIYIYIYINIYIYKLSVSCHLIFLTQDALLIKNYRKLRCTIKLLSVVALKATVGAVGTALLCPINQWQHSHHVTDCAQTHWSQRKSDRSFWSPYVAQVTAHLRSAHAYSFRLHLRTSQGYSPRALLALTNWTEETGTTVPCFIHAFDSHNPLQPSGHYTYHQFNICSAHTVHFCVRTNSDYFTVQHWLVGFYNWDGVCLLRGTGWVYIIDVNSILWLMKALHNFAVLLCQYVAITVRPLRSRLKLCTYDLPCHACYIYRPIFIYLFMLSNRAVY